jgi:hypothetical protein
MVLNEPLGDRETPSFRCVATRYPLDFGSAITKLLGSR